MKFAKKHEMNKKGFLLGEVTVKIVIATICIVLLVFLLLMMYSMFTKQSKIDNAEASLNWFKAGIISAKNSPDGKFTGVLIEPKTWVLVYFQGNVPNTCSGIKCLCICAEASSWWFTTTQSEAQFEECESSGACISMDDEVKNSVVEVEEIVIKEPVNVLIESSAGKIKISKSI